MTESTSTSLAALHPGAILRERFLSAMELGESEAAAHLGIPAEELTCFIDGKTRLTPELAVRIHTAMGDSVEEWLCRQARYDADRLDVAVEMPTLPKLQSRYWGREVGSFTQSVKVYKEGAPLNCFVTLSFSPDGQARIVLSAFRHHHSPSVTSHYETVAAKVVARLVSNKVALADLLNGDEAGFSHFQEKLQRVHGRLQSEKRLTLESLSAAARIIWYEHTPRDRTSQYGGEAVRPVLFTDDDCPNWQPEVASRSVLSQATIDTVHHFGNAR